MNDFAPTRHIVLIHGAWQGSWAFDAWRPFLVQRNFVVHAVDLPGNKWPPAGDDRASLEAYVQSVAQVIDGIDEPVVLVGHSGGGITASQVAEARPERLRALVYLAGMMLPSGMSFVQLLRDVEATHPGRNFAGITPYLDWNADRTESTVRLEGALKCFVQDCDADAAKAAAQLLRAQPESGRDMRNQLTPERFGRVPRIYVECAHDQSVFVELQRRMQELTPGAIRVEMACGHVPQLADPEGLTRKLLGALATLAA